MIGKEIGNYRITAEINSGAFGSVYKAEHIHLKERVVAIKLLHAYIGSRREREQFAQEAQFLAQLEHPHILQLLDFGFNEQQPYLIARYAGGGSLRDRLKQQKPLPIEEAVNILTQIGQALYYAHQRNIIHRDLKPENILFNAQGDAVLADFGIATMLSTANARHLATIEGTPSYMAPEQFRGIISKEGDQYALGCIGYELVTGSLPFTAPDFLSMGWKHINERPLAPGRHNPQVPSTTEAAILKAMAKQRSDRHTDIPAFLAALRVSFTQASLLNPLLPAQSIMQTSSSVAPVPLASASSAQTVERWLLVGNEHFSAGRYVEALVAYEQAIRLDPNSVEAYHSKGITLYKLQFYKEALVAYEQAVRLDPGFVEAYHSKGVTLYELWRYEEALAAYEQAIRLDPGFAEAYHSKGATLYKLQFYKEALVAYEQAVRFDPGFAEAYRSKGATLYELRRYEEALVAYEQAIRLDPGFAVAYNDKGYTLERLGRQREAQQAYAKARESGYKGWPG